MAKYDDPCEVAYSLIHNADLYPKLMMMIGKIATAQIDTQAKCRGLRQVGSHKISAPDLLAGDMLAAIKALHQFTGDCITQIETILAEVPTGLE